MYERLARRTQEAHGDRLSGRELDFNRASFVSNGKSVEGNGLLEVGGKDTAMLNAVTNV